jgi:hypothetical protein
MRFHGLQIKGVRIRLDDGQGVLGTFPEAGAEAVAVLFGHQPGLSTRDFNGALGAGGDAQAATIAFFFINPDDFSFDLHLFLPFSFRFGLNIMPFAEICFDLSQGHV